MQHVLVIDDQRSVREGLRRLIAIDGRRTVHVAANEAEALETSGRCALDLVVLDVDLCGHDGLLLIGRLPRAVPVLVLTSHGDAQTRARAFALGARAFVDKREPADALLRQVHWLTHDAADLAHDAGRAG